MTSSMPENIVRLRSNVRASLITSFSRSDRTFGSAIDSRSSTCAAPIIRRSILAAAKRINKLAFLNRFSKVGAWKVARAGVVPSITYGVEATGFSLAQRASRDASRSMRCLGGRWSIDHLRPGLGRRPLHQHRYRGAYSPVGHVVVRVRLPLFPGGVGELRLFFPSSPRLCQGSR